MAAVAKHVNHIARARTAMKAVKDALEEANAVIDEYNSLYVTVLTEDDFSVEIEPDVWSGSHTDVIPSGAGTTRLESFQDSIAALGTIVSTWDAGQDTTLERVVA
jgi:hypothetical protein